MRGRYGYSGRAVALVVLGLACALPASASAAQRFADPSVLLDSDAPCTQDKPCNVIKAVNRAAKGDEVILKPGSYVLVRTGVTLQPPFGGVAVHGVLDQPRPTIVSDSDQVLFLNQGSSARWLAIQSSAQNGQGLVLGDSASRADQVVSEADGASASPCEILGTLVNVVCYAKGANSNAVEARLTDGLAANPVLRNVTAVAPAPDATAVYISASLNPPSGASRSIVRRSSRLRRSTSGVTAVKLSAFNVIASGGIKEKGGFDVFANASGGGTATGTFDYSNYADVQLTGTGASVSAPGSAHNQQKEPKFAGLKGGDLHEGTCSPTIAAGVTDPANGTLDADNFQRVINGRTDIGAYESSMQPPAPSVSAAGPGATPFSFGAFQANPNSGSGTLAVSVPGAGKLDVRDATDYGGSPAGSARGTAESRVAADCAVTGGSGVVSLKLGPTRAGKRILRKRGHLHTRVIVGFTPSGGKPTAKLRSVTLTRGRP